MRIQRLLKSVLLDRLRLSNKVVVLYGPRQVGKTTLCEELIHELNLKTLSVSGDEQSYSDIILSRNKEKLLEWTSNYELLFIDEAQRYKDIGLTLKILHDHAKHLKILCTGSSSFELANRVAEPLTGRKWTYQLYPISTKELNAEESRIELQEHLENRLIWGSYPEIFQLKGREDKLKYLRELSTDYLYRDVLMIGELRHADKVRKLLKLLAFQIGKEVSLTELGKQLEMSKDTVARYLDLLEKSFVIFRIGGFSQNLRKEVSKMSKYYFYDLGIRNALIDAFQTLENRNDQGEIWENFIISERMKQNAYKETGATSYFWRTYDGQEVDLVEESQGRLHGFECKWNKSKSKSHSPRSWHTVYPKASFKVIHCENWLDFLL